jgi:hypothetical protein
MADIKNETPSKKERLPRLLVDKTFLDHVHKLGGLGLTRLQIAYYYGHTESQWSAKIKKHPEIDIAMREGKANRIEKASGYLWEWIEKRDKASIMFFLKTQAGWREAAPIIEDGEKDSKPTFPAITLTVNDPIEAAKIYQQIMIGS